MRPDGAVPAPAPKLGPPRTRREPPAKLSSTGLPLAKCEFCREAIVWAETFPNPNARTAEARREVKLVPIDPEPSTVTQANLVVTLRAVGRPQVGEMRVNQAAGFRQAGGKTYIRHIKTCVKAEEMRRGVVKRHKR